MPETRTVFGSLNSYEKGTINIIGDDNPAHYAFSNVFEVAANAGAYERVVAAINLEYVVEVVRAEGESQWYICSHDETALAMDGEIIIELLSPENSELLPPAEQHGAVRIGAAVGGRKMGTITIRRGHLALLPVGTAYRFSADIPSVVLIQTLLGDESIQKWSEICAN